MAVYCANDYYCISNTGFSTLDDNYTQSGTYNLRDYFVGGTNGYYIYFTGSLWCLSDTLGGSCFLQGKYPYSGLCPDLSTSYVNATVCATPTPTQTIGCGNLSFDAIFAINITNTPSVTPTMTRTPTITPSVTITNFCPFIGVSASVSYISPTPTPTITPTPKTVAQRNRAPVISCSFNGDVTFTTVNSVISCPVSRQFQDCSTGFIYRTSSSVTNPSGGDFSQFMIFEGLVDGIYRCITYLGLDSNNQSVNQITLQVGPIGYSNLGQCNLCFNAGTLTPTPTPTLTPTPTVTPSAGLCLGLCSVLYISFDNQQIYTLDLGSFSYQPLPFSNVGTRSDIAHTVNRVFANTNNDIKVWNISLCSFSSSYIKQVGRTPGTPSFGTGLFAIDDNTLLTWDGTVGISPRSILRINLTPNLDTINLSDIDVLFSIPIDREPFGDLILTNNNKLIIFTRDSDNDVYISQFIYPSGGAPEVDILIPQYTWPPLGISLSVFVNNNQIYIIDEDGLIHSIDNTYPYTITEYFNFGFNDVGTSQIQSCINVSFIPYTPQVTYYVYKLCNDTVGPQTYIFQTVPSITIIPGNTFINESDGTCWSFEQTTIIVPENSPFDVIVYDGNYFTNVNSTIYTNCTDCINNLPCERPSGLTNYIIYNGYEIDNGPNNSWPQSSVGICNLLYDFYNEGVSLGLTGQLAQSESLEVGTYVYFGIFGPSALGCDCYGNGFYLALPFNASTAYYSLGTIIEISNCIIVSSYPCSPINGTSPSNPNGSGGSGGSGGNGGNGGNNPGGGPNPSSTCECTAVRTISGFQGTAFYTDCNGNPAQITVPGGTGIAGAACFCRQPSTPVTGAVIIEACQSTFGQGTINNICNSTISCS